MAEYKGNLAIEIIGQVKKKTMALQGGAYHLTGREYHPGHNINY